MYSHLLLDFDGTLVAQSRTAKVRFLLHSLRALRGHCTARQVIHAARTISEALPLSRGDITAQKQAEVLFAKNTGLGAATYQAMCAEVIGRTQVQRCYRGVREFLKWASQRFTLILATNPIFSRRVLEQRLLRSGIPIDLFAQVTSSDRFHYVKPRVEYYQELLSLYGLNPSSCLMIGNDPVKDGPALQVGIDLVLLGKASSVKGAKEFRTFKEIREWMEEAL